MQEPQDSPSEELQRKLHIDAALAERLVAGQLTTVKEVAYVPLAEFLDVSGLASEPAAELRRIAKYYLLNE